MVCGFLCVCVWFSVNYNTSCWVSWGFFFSSCLKHRLRAMVGDSEAEVAYAYRMPCAILKSNQVEKPCWAYTMRLIACSWAKATSKDCRPPPLPPPLSPPLSHCVCNYLHKPNTKCTHACTNFGFGFCVFGGFVGLLMHISHRWRGWGGVRGCIDW